MVRPRRPPGPKLSGRGEHPLAVQLPPRHLILAQHPPVHRAQLRQHPRRRAQSNPHHQPHHPLPPLTPILFLRRQEPIPSSSFPLNPHVILRRLRDEESRRHHASPSYGGRLEPALSLSKRWPPLLSSRMRGPIPHCPFLRNRARAAIPATTIYPHVLE